MTAAAGCCRCDGPSNLCTTSHREHARPCFPNVTTCSVGKIRAKYTNEVNTTTELHIAISRVISNIYCHINIE